MKAISAIIMCTWKRIECLERTLELLDKQKNKNFIFYVVNNNVAIKKEIDIICQKYQNKLKISICNNNSNRGGFGRFELAKTLVNKHEIIIFIDDDQIFTDDMVDIFIEKYESDSVKSRWAFKFSDRYFHRERIFEDNVDVEYCGTGGMVLPSKLFLCEELYKIPIKYFFIEDLWLSFVATHYANMKLRSIGNGDGFIRQVSDGKDQSTIDKIPLKDELLQYTRKIKNESINNR